MFSSRSSLRSALKAITNGTHDDEQCRDFEKEFEKKFSTDAPTCELKDDPESIKRLIEKMEIETKMPMNQNIVQLVNFMNRHTLVWTKKEVHFRDSYVGLTPLWIDIEKTESFIGYAKTYLSSFFDVTLVSLWDDLEPSLVKLCKDLCWKHGPAAFIKEEQISILIIYDHEDFHLDTFVKARDHVIIVTKSNRRYKY